MRPTEPRNALSACCGAARRKLYPVTLFIVTMSAIAYLERHRPPPTLPERFGQQRSPSLVIEPIFDDAAEDAPIHRAEQPQLALGSRNWGARVAPIGFVRRGREVFEERFGQIPRVEELHLELHLGNPT